MRLAPRPVSASAVETVQLMSQLQANNLGNVHGGVIMRGVDDVGGQAASRHARLGSWRPDVEAHPDGHA